MRQLPSSSQIAFKTTHRALTGAPPPPARLDSTRRGQTCRVVLVGQMTSRRTGESPRDRAAPARLLTLRETGRPEGPHTRSLVIQRGRAGADTDTADNRHAHQPQGRPRTQTLPRSEPIAPPQHGSSSRRALTFASERERQRPAPWPEGVSPTQAISHNLPVNSRDAWWAGGHHAGGGRSARQTTAADALEASKR